MTKRFESDSFGAVLEFAFLSANQNTPDQGIIAGRTAWENTNIKQASLRTSPGNVVGGAFAGPGAIDKATLHHLLSGGRNRDQVRQELDRVFWKLEAMGLIMPWSGDDNSHTLYRCLTPLGEELFLQNQYLEFIEGPGYIAKAWQGSLVKVFHPKASGIGTGFIVGDRLIATAGHVVKELGEFVVELSNGARPTHKQVHYADDTGEVDVALIELNEQIPGLRPFGLSPHRQLLDDVVIFGYPPVPQSKAAYLIVNKGEVSAEIEFYNRKVKAMILSCLIRGGHSGGPVVNRRGQVIGVISENLFKQVSPEEKSINEGLGFAAAVGCEHLIAMLDSVKSGGRR